MINRNAGAAVAARCRPASSWHPYIADHGAALRKLELGNQRIPMRRVNEATAHMFIVNPLKGNKLAALFSTHPPMEERIRRLEGMRL